MGGIVKLAFLGGTGPQGLGLAMRFARAGEEVIIGSRVEDRARDAAAEVKRKIAEAKVSGMLNGEAAEAGDMVFVTVPFGAQERCIEGVKDRLKGKVIVDVTNPLSFDKETKCFGLCEVPHGSASLQIQKLLGGSKVVCAFKTISSKRLMGFEDALGCDVLVCSDHEDAKKEVMELIERIDGLRAVDCGKLENSRYVEAICALLLNINRIYHVESGAKITGI